MIRNLTNGERLVAEGIRFELKDGETRIATSAEIAHWANVSESTVSRALPGLIHKHVIAARRVVYAETGRERWELTLLPLDQAGRLTPAPNIQDAMSAVPDNGSVMDATKATLRPPAMPQTPAPETSMTDPSNIQDSESCMQQQHGAPADRFVRATAQPTPVQSPESAAYPPELAHCVLRAPDSLAHGVYPQSETLAGNTGPSGEFADLVIASAHAKIRRTNPAYSAADFAANLTKAFTRFGPDERERAVALVVWCALRNEPVYSREELRARIPPGPLGDTSDPPGSCGPQSRTRPGLSRRTPRTVAQPDPDALAFYQRYFQRKLVATRQHRMTQVEGGAV